MSKEELKKLCEFFDKFGDNGGQYIDEDWINYNGKLPTIYIKGIWPNKFGDKIYLPRGAYLPKKSTHKKKLS